MAHLLDPPLVARNKSALEVVLVCRISSPGVGKQDPRSTDDQEAMLRNWLENHYDGAVHVNVLAGSGSGELLDRREYLELFELVDSGKIDLVLTEDVGRIARRMHAHIFCETCTDYNTRVISVNDRFDTAVGGWQDVSIISAWHHERSNRDTSERIKRTHRNRFDQGGCAAIPPYGYVKPPGSRSDGEWHKDPDAESVLVEWFRMLDDGATYSEVADWLNAGKIQSGKYCRQTQWDGRMVARVTHNLLLKGCRVRNRRTTRRRRHAKVRTNLPQYQTLRAIVVRTDYGFAKNDRTRAITSPLYR